ncbi:porin [Paraburkholderia sp. HP33-1]|uniref:porin n=1 Tax=Paraburkholderia sp. HP33-1 TaxID=2883243 RepID=UPI001F41EF88|nr:porin [Paraburkholderia sp. HP33-1]
MKSKTLSHAVLLATMYGTNVFAQSSVTLYGAVDDAVTYVNNQKGHSNVYMRSGNLTTSVWGLNGVEDLGGGLATIFQVESSFDMNSGAATTSGLIFNRQAYMGLRDRKYGTVTMGRQYTPYFLLVGPLAPAATMAGAVGARPGDIDSLDKTTRANSSVTYTSPVLRGLQASAMYGFGGNPGSIGSGQTISAALQYSSGPLGVAAGYLRMENAQPGVVFGSTSSASLGTTVVNQGYLTASRIEDAAIAANYTIGALRLGAVYANVRYLAGNQSAFLDTVVFNNYGIFGTYRIRPDLESAAAVSYTVASRANTIQDPAKYLQFSLKQAYLLSKRTTLYALEGFTHATGKTLGVSGIKTIVTAAPVVGDSQNLTPSSTPNQVVVMIGIASKF